MRRAASLLFVLLAAPFAAAMEVPSSSTAAVRVSTAPAGVSAAARLEDDYRRARARVQRARRALKKAEADGDPGGAREARGELARALEALNDSREKMRAALKAGSVSPEYAALKKSVRDDLNAVRRARYALNKARRRSDAKGIVEAEHRLREAKSDLKEHRARMRSLLRKR